MTSKPLAEPFSKREVEILRLLEEGLTNQEIADSLFLTQGTVKWYNKQIFSKLGVSNRIQAIRKAIDGLLNQKILLPAWGKVLANHNFPVPIGSFVGRQYDIAVLRNYLNTHRLVTLTGAGGVGKTRLGLAVAETLLDKFPDGAWFVDLASLSNPGMLTETVASAVGVHAEPGWSLLDTLHYYFRNRHALLLLDNCEHLVATCASLAESLLDAAPGLKVMATSRESLRLPGEVIFRVPSLSFPAAGEFPPLEELATYEAVVLFYERARGVLPEFRVTPDNSHAVAQICRQLDGIPLALELAAARLVSLDVDQIASRLEHAFHLLATGNRTKTTRQRTLWAAIDWSYQLLAEKERLLLQRLSVFSGGAVIEAVEAVCSGNGIETVDIQEWLFQLVCKSMLQVDRKPDSPPRHQILEIVRQYAAGKLVESGESERLHRAHLDYHLGLAEELGPKLRERDQVKWLLYLENELGNLRLALDWGLQTDVEAELRLASSLKWFWHIRNYWKEGTAWLEKGLDLVKKDRSSLLDGDLSFTHTSRSAIQAYALSVAAHMEIFAGNPGKAMAILNESLAIYRKLIPQDRRGMAHVLWAMAKCNSLAGNLTQLYDCLHESLGLFREIGDRLGISECLIELTVNEDRPERIRSYGLETLELARSAGDTDAIATTLNVLGLLTSEICDYPTAIGYIEESMSCSRQVGNIDAVASQLTFMGRVAWNMGEAKQANQHYQAALDVLKNTGAYWNQSRCHMEKACIGISQGNTFDALQDANEALRISQDTSHHIFIVLSLLVLAKLASAQGQVSLAYQRCDDALVKANEIEDFHLICAAYYFKAAMALVSRDTRMAHLLLGRSLAFCEDNQNQLSRIEMADLLDACAILAVLYQEMEQAARLFGAAEHIFKIPSGRIMSAMNPAISAIERSWREREMTAARDTLGNSIFMKFWTEGQGWSRAQAVTCALKIARDQEG